MDQNPFIHGPMGWMLFLYLVITLGGGLILVLYSSFENYMLKRRQRYREKHARD